MAVKNGLYALLSTTPSVNSLIAAAQVVAVIGSTAVANATNATNVILKGVINTIGGGGTHGVASGGAAGDAACFVANDSTHWTVYVQSGTWTAN